MLLIRVKNLLPGASACKLRWVWDLGMESEELAVPVFDVPAWSRLDIRNGLGVISGSPNPPLATELLDSLLAVNILICVKTELIDDTPLWQSNP